MPRDPETLPLANTQITRPTTQNNAESNALGNADSNAASNADTLAQLNARFRHHSASAVLQAVLRDRVAGRVAMVSSFGAESVALLHLVATLDATTPVLFIDTAMLFTETLVYQQELAERLRLRDLRVISAAPDQLAQQDPYGALRLSDPDACCSLRKTRPLQKALGSFEGWITGRKRFQSGTRAALDFFEPDPTNGKIKINPLAYWTPKDVLDYIEENRLPRHPLVAKGFPSIGCRPCTSAVRPGEDPRAGRWRGAAKTECGIHFANGTTQRNGATK